MSHKVRADCEVPIVAAERTERERRIPEREAQALDFNRGLPQIFAARGIRGGRWLRSDQTIVNLKAPDLCDGICVFLSWKSEPQILRIGR